MGCDIHCYVEYKTKHEGDWQDFGGRINPGRNYGMFGVLAGVRAEEYGPLYKLRGFPNDAAFYARSDQYLFIREDDQPADRGTCSKSNAKIYVEQYGSHYWGSESNPKSFVSNPDWHSHSWLTTEEFEKCVKHFMSDVFDDYYGTDYGFAKNQALPEYKAILAAMKSFEEMGFQSRLVFWFDN